MNRTNRRPCSGMRHVGKRQGRDAHRSALFRGRARGRVRANSASARAPSGGAAADAGLAEPASRIRSGPGEKRRARGGSRGRPQPSARTRPQAAARSGESLRRRDQGGAKAGAGSSCRRRRSRRRQAASAPGPLRRDRPFSVRGRHSLIGGRPGRASGALRARPSGLVRLYFDGLRRRLYRREPDGRTREIRPAGGGRIAVRRRSRGQSGGCAPARLLELSFSARAQRAAQLDRRRRDPPARPRRKRRAGFRDAVVACNRDRVCVSEFWRLAQGQLSPEPDRPPDELRRTLVLVPYHFGERNRRPPAVRIHSRAALPPCPGSRRMGARAFGLRPVGIVERRRQPGASDIGRDGRRRRRLGVPRSSAHRNPCACVRSRVSWRESPSASIYP